MRDFVLAAMILALFGCNPDKHNHTEIEVEEDVIDYPDKVKSLLRLIENIKPKTNRTEWILMVDQKIDLPEEDILLYGGGNLGEYSEALSIGISDEWAVSIDTRNGNDFIWRAQVIRTSISKWVANEGAEIEVIYPYYLDGRIIHSESDLNNAEQHGAE